MKKTRPPQSVKAWRCISQRFKVTLQVAAQCVDTGLLEPGALVISLGGSSHGTDTAVALRAYGADDVFKIKVIEIIAIETSTRTGRLF